MALFRSNRGMHLLALPTTHADAENTRRKNIQDGGTTTASRLLAQARVLPQEALVCGSPGRIFPVVEALQRQSSCPFVLIGTALDLTDSPLLRLPVQWQDTVLPDRLPEGSGRITINPGEFGMGMMQMADWGGTHTILLCLGQGLSASTELLDALNACGDYVLLCSSLSRAVPGRTGGLTTEGLLRSMRDQLRRLQHPLRPRRHDGAPRRQRLQLWPEPRSGHQARAFAGRPHRAPEQLGVSGL